MFSPWDIVNKMEHTDVQLRNQRIWVSLEPIEFPLIRSKCLNEWILMTFPSQMRSSIFSIATVISLFWTWGTCYPRNRHRIAIDMMKGDSFNYDYNLNYSTTPSDTPTATIYAVHTYIFSYLDPLEVTAKGISIQCDSDSTLLCGYTPSLTQSSGYATLPSMTGCPTSSNDGIPQFPKATYSSSGEVCTISNVYSTFEKGNLYVTCNDQANWCKDFGLNFPGQMVYTFSYALTKVTLLSRYRWHRMPSSRVFSTRQISRSIPELWWRYKYFYQRFGEAETGTISFGTKQCRLPSRPHQSRYAIQLG